MGFPSSWPKGCPPADAQPAGGPVYRIVSNNPPTEHDLKSYAELGLGETATPCRRVALSVYPSREQAQHHQRMRPYIGTMVGRATLAPEHGCTKLTAPASGHMAWWPADGIERHTLFVEVIPC